jgi:hypothetical protein
MHDLAEQCTLYSLYSLQLPFEMVLIVQCIRECVEKPLDETLFYSVQVCSTRIEMEFIHMWL